MRKVTRVTNQIIRDEVVVDQSFARVIYDEVQFWNCRFESTAWTHCRFSRVSFANGTVFERCQFTKCRFFRQHTYFGGPSRFLNCRFEGCDIEDVQFFQSAFEHCSFSGKLTNVLFYGPLAPPELRSSFQNVDLSRASLTYVGFESGFDLSTTILPAEGGSRLQRTRPSS